MRIPHIVTIAASTALASIVLGCTPHGAGAIEPRTGTAVIEHVGVGSRLVIGGPADQAASSADDEPEAAGFDQDAIRLCESGTPELDGAKMALSELGRKIDALDNKASTKTTTEEIRALLATSCFELAAMDHPELDLDDDLRGTPEDRFVFDSGLALKTWWREGGASQWLAEYIDRNTRQTSLPASPRRSLFLDSISTTTTTNGNGKQPHPLAPLLCPAKDASASIGSGCGRETVGWMRRAEAALDRKHGSARWDKTDETCEAEALAAPPAARYGVLRTCRENAAELRDALPLGRFKAPTDGFLMIEGRGGGGCDDLHVYDLATGAAWQVECTYGHPAHATNGATPSVSVTTGRVPLAALREAAWMLFLSRVKQDAVRPIDSFFVPQGIMFGRPRGGDRGRTGGHWTLYGSSHERVWTWMRSLSSAKHAHYTGQLSGRLVDLAPNTATVEGHATELIAIAEDGFIAGCAPPGSPTSAARTIAWDQPGPTLDPNMTVDFERPESDDVHRAWASTKPAPRCGIGADPLP